MSAEPEREGTIPATMYTEDDFRDSSPPPVDPSLADFDVNSAKEAKLHTETFDNAPPVKRAASVDHHSLERKSEPMPPCTWA